MKALARIPSVLSLALPLALALASQAAADTVAVRLLDQEGVEHSLGVICVDGTSDCAASGGTLELNVGDTVDFKLRPSTANDRLGELEVLSTFLSRTVTAVVTAGQMEFTWDRARWTVRVVDQDGFEHSEGELLRTTSGGAPSPVKGEAGDVMRVPVTSYADDAGADAEGWSLRLTPSTANDRLGEMEVHTTYLRRNILRPVDVDDAGEFRWDRAPWRLSLVDQDGVEHEKGEVIRLSVSNRPIPVRGINGDVMRVPVTSYPDDEGLDAEGWSLRVTPSTANDRLGEMEVHTTYLRRNILRPVDVDDAGEFRWDRAPWRLSLVDQDGVEHEKGEVIRLSVSNRPIPVRGINGDVMRVPVTSYPDDEGLDAEGWSLRVTPSTANDRLGEMEVHTTYLRRNILRPVDVDDAGEFRWDRAPWRLSLVDQDGVEHEKGEVIRLSVSNRPIPVRGINGDVMRVPVTSYPDDEGLDAEGWSLRVTPSTANDRLGEMEVHTTYLRRNILRPVDVDDAGEFRWDRAPWRLSLVDQDGVEHEKGEVIRLSVSNRPIPVRGINGDVMRVPVTSYADDAGADAEGWSLRLTPSSANDRQGELAVKSSYLRRTLVRPVDGADQGVFTWNRAVWNFRILDQHGLEHPGASVARPATQGPGHPLRGESGDVMRVPVTSYTDDEGLDAEGYELSLAGGATSSRHGDQPVNFRLLELTVERAVQLGDDGAFTWDRACGTLEVLGPGAEPATGTTVSSISQSQPSWQGAHGDVLFVPSTEFGDHGRAYASGYDLSGRLGSTNQSWSAPEAEVDSLGFVTTPSFNIDGVVYEVHLGGSCNLPPVAQAGLDHGAEELALVTLDGSESSDPNGDALTFSWSQVAGPAVVLDDASASQPSFTAPAVAVGGETLTFELVVRDSESTSAPDSVNVTVSNVNSAPVADAGDDQVAREGVLVSLDGSASYDGDGDAFTFAWTQVAGPLVVLDDAAVEMPDFVTPQVGPEGTLLEFQLVVNDGELDSEPATVQVIVENVNQAPMADAGADRTVDEGALVSLDGTASSDPDGDALTHAWVQVSGPSVVLDDATLVRPGFTAPAVGAGGEELRFELVVDDGLVASFADEVSVHVRNVNDPPSCSLAVASSGSLWPPNHRLVSVGIQGVSDPNDDDVSVTITEVTQDEPVNGLGDGDTSPDAVIDDEDVLLRAERSGTGDGRVYVVHFTADDGMGGTCSGSVTTSVPHSRKSTPVDSGQMHDALQD